MFDNKQTNENAALTLNRSGVKVDESDVLSALRQIEQALESAIPQPCGDSTQSLPILPSLNAVRFDTAYQSHGFVHSSAVFVPALAQGLESVRANARRIVHRMWSGTDDLMRNETTDGQVLLGDKGRLCGSWVPFAHSLSRVR